MLGRPEGLAPEVDARSSLLEVRNLTQFFGNLRAVHDF